MELSSVEFFKLRLDILERSFTVATRYIHSLDALRRGETIYQSEKDLLQDVEIPYISCQTSRWIYLDEFDKGDSVFRNDSSRNVSITSTLKISSQFRTGIVLGGLWRTRHQGYIY